MDANPAPQWHSLLRDPTGERGSKPRLVGATMVIDKGLGLRAFEDLVQTAGEYIDMIKLGFGTSVLYPADILRRKIEIAREHGILIMPGGTFLEVAVSQGLVGSFFRTVSELGFTGVEVSDGTIELSRRKRSELIILAIENGTRVVTEYGKKMWGSKVEIDEFVETALTDTALGAEHVTIEGRESGVGVGIYNEKGECDEDEIALMLSRIPRPGMLMWEAPLKSQQVQLINTLGPAVNLGNIAPEEVIALEALRRGLRSDTFFAYATAKTNGNL